MSNVVENIKECFKGLVGTKNLCLNQEDRIRYKHYIEDLPGLSIGNIARIAPADKISAKALIDQKIQFAIDSVTLKALDMLRERFGLTLNTLIERAEFGVDNSNRAGACTFLQSPNNCYQGLKLSGMESMLSCFYLESLSIVVGNDVKRKIIEIVNPSTGDLLDQFQVDLTKGQRVIIPVNKVYDPSTIWIRYNASNVLTANTIVKHNQIKGCCGGSFKCISAQGYDGHHHSQQSFGLSATAELRCCKDKLLCILADCFSMAILYQAGVEILEEACAPNGRLNVFKIKADDWASGTIPYWEKKVDKIIKNGIAGSLSVLKQSQGKCKCIECAGPVQVTWRP